MASDPATALTERQRELLALVVEEYVASGQPVGSRHLVERGGLRVSPSTVRNELAELESQGLLTHPHTSANSGIEDDLPVSVNRCAKRRSPEHRAVFESESRARHDSTSSPLSFTRAASLR